MFPMARSGLTFEYADNRIHPSNDPDAKIKTQKVCKTAYVSESGPPFWLRGDGISRVKDHRKARESTQYSHTRIYDGEPAIFFCLS